MKKIILLLILPFITLMAIDFTMTEEGLFAKTTTQSPTPVPTPPVTVAGGTSSYLETVNLPACDAGNPEVHFINNKSDWSQINNGSKHIFCVSPGDYRSLGQIKLTVSGTTNKKRYIVLNNGNNTHPAQLNENELANFALEVNSDYWVIDRPYSYDISGYFVSVIEQGSSNNIINRWYTTNTTNPLWIRGDANNNTIQNSMFNGKSRSGYDSELGGIIMEDWDKVTNIHGTKIINNEFINMNAVRLGDKEDNTHYFNNTIIDGNVNEYNDDRRSDCGAATKLNPDGDCSITEDFLVVLKGGSSNINEPVIVSNNVAYGIRKSREIGEIGFGGDCITSYMGVDHVQIHNNVFFDSTGGITVADSYGQPWGTLNHDIHTNVLKDCGGYFGNDLVAPLRMYDAKDANIQNNLIINPVGTYWAKVGDNVSGSIFGNNDVVNVGSTTLLAYGSGWTQEKNNFYSTSIEAGYTEDFTFTVYKFTNTPRVITLENVLKPN